VRTWESTVTDSFFLLLLFICYFECAKSSKQFQSSFLFLFFYFIIYFSNIYLFLFCFYYLIINYLIFIYLLFIIFVFFNY